MQELSTLAAPAPRAKNTLNPCHKFFLQTASSAAPHEGTFQLLDLAATSSFMLATF
jgi:hypothetical protein